MVLIEKAQDILKLVLKFSLFTEVKYSIFCLTIQCDIAVLFLNIFKICIFFSSTIALFTPNFAQRK